MVHQLPDKWPRLFTLCNLASSLAVISCAVARDSDAVVFVVAPVRFLARQSTVAGVPAARIERLRPTVSAPLLSLQSSLGLLGVFSCAMQRFLQGALALGFRPLHSFAHFYLYDFLALQSLLVHRSLHQLLAFLLLVLLRVARNPLGDVPLFLALSLQGVLQVFDQQSLIFGRRTVHIVLSDLLHDAASAQYSLVPLSLFALQRVQKLSRLVSLGVQFCLARFEFGFEVLDLQGKLVHFTVLLFGQGLAVVPPWSIGLCAGNLLEKQKCSHVYCTEKQGAS